MSGRNNNKTLDNTLSFTFDIKQTITGRSEATDSFQSESDYDQADAEEKVELKSILKSSSKPDKATNNKVIL